MSHAYPSEARFWVLPFSVAGSSETMPELGIACAAYAEAILATSYEGGQTLITPQETALALILTNRSQAQAFAYGPIDAG